ncbi:MAG TPA: menaquinone biosynthesis protein [Thermoanaerobaculia bacterium]|jgi:chorismate dehydratase|nr:menaquinone biosynthesis protein [Thermoanaerobaculia bacterium]
MPSLRISVVDFLNARPLTWGLLHQPPPGIAVSRDVPSACAAKLASGEADVGLIPSIEYQRIPGLRVVPALGIAAASEVRSVLLVSDVSREKIRSVSLDPASRTSAVLTRILLKRVYGLEPEYRDGPSDARLIIGDPAMKTRWNGHVVLDLAAEWRAFSGQPFVFAFWAAREPVATAELAALLRRSYEAGLANFAGMVREEASASGLSEAVVEDYLRHALHFELDAGDLEGLRLFYRLAAEDGLIPAARPLAFTPAS